MEKVILAVHLLIAVGLIGVILIQRSEGGGLGLGGGGNMGGMMTARGTANLLTRTTAILAACFMLTSIVLAVLAGKHTQPVSILDGAGPGGSSAPVAAPAEPAAPPPPPAAPAAPVSQ